MTKHFFIGVDGGATKCIVRMEDEAGHVIGQASHGSANIRFSVEQAWQSIHAAIVSILQKQNMRLEDPHVQFHAGMGLAGCEVVSAYQAFLHHAHYSSLFHTLKVISDAHIACVGAHGGRDGAIIIAGTGVVGWQIQAHQTTQVGGNGFPHDDDGGGAWLGLQAVKITFQWLDGRMPASMLATAIFDYFHGDQQHFIDWANQANSAAFAALAPIVIVAAKAGDVVAIHLLQQAADTMHRIHLALIAKTKNKKSLPIALGGSIAPLLEPYLHPTLRTHLCAAQFAPEMGVILWIKNNL